MFGNKTWLDGYLEDEPIKVAITLGESLHDFGGDSLAEDIHKGNCHLPCN
jgi:hypothetical protein